MVAAQALVRSLIAVAIVNDYRGHRYNTRPQNYKRRRTFRLRVLSAANSRALRLMAGNHGSRKSIPYRRRFADLGSGLHCTPICRPGLRGSPARGCNLDRYRQHIRQSPRLVGSRVDRRSIGCRLLSACPGTECDYNPVGLARRLTLASDKHQSVAPLHCGQLRTWQLLGQGK